MGSRLPVVGRGAGRIVRLEGTVLETLTVSEGCFGRWGLTRGKRWSVRADFCISVPR